MRVMVEFIETSIFGNLLKLFLLIFRNE